MSAAALALSLTLQVRPDGRVAVPGLRDHPLPEACLAQRWFHMRCPGCGLTRSFISLAHGHWHQSITYHRLGWLLFLAAALQVPYRLRRLYGPPPLPAKRKGVGLWLGWALVALLIGNWCAEMILGHWT
jgi:hypothetical protein